jgi:outer membrane protein assembly factor BamB
MKPKLFLIAVLSVISALTAFAADWPAYRGPTHDGKSTEKMPAWPANGPRALWKIPTPNGFSSFSVKDGRAFTLVLREVDGVNMEALIAVDAENGKELWSASFAPAKYDGGGDSGTRDNGGGDGPRSTPAIDGSRVYVLTSDLLLACFDAASGKEVWKRNIIKENHGRNISWKNAASPLIDGDIVMVAGGGPGEALLGINKENGQVIWKGEDDKITHASPILADILGARQAIFFTQKGLVAVQPADGKLLWRHPFRYNVSTAASPVVAGDIVYCSAGYGVGSTAIQLSRNGDAFSAKELWRITGDKIANHWSTPVEKDGYLYGMFQFKQYGSGPVKCIELRTGKEKWSQAGFGPGNVILVGGELVALTDGGEVVRIDPRPDAYQEKGRFKAVTGKCWSTPAYADGRIYVRSTKEGAAFDMSNKLTSR